VAIILADMLKRQRQEQIDNIIARRHGSTAG
jgi:hypothetical protein